ncbi:MAG TPA: Fur family transcriptional regulator [Candidatus Saccharimonadales bacterium]|nr:Fur family transcriptional regulator [Candidatus Saccharimonadales bacterium]
MPEATQDKLRLTLRSRHASLTRRRLEVFKAFGGHTPLSMNQLVKLLPDMDRATVYRTTKLFEELGIIDRVLLGWKYKLELSDSFSPHHHHLSCNNCGRVNILAEDNQLEAYIKSLSHRAGFQAIDHQLEINGLCPACQKLSKV